ncbi:MAG: PQQ-binding-like beta-propeller repeat protein [Limisphaerales bacterium]
MKTIIACLLLCVGWGCFAQPTTNLWAFHMGNYDSASSPAIAPDGAIYVGSFTGDLLALSPQGVKKWAFPIGMEIKSSPAVADDGTVYFGSRDRHLYALTPAGKLKWKFPTGAWVDSSPAIGADGVIYFGSWDTNFYALNPSGDLKWRFPSGGIIDSSPAIGRDGSIYFGSHDRYCYALDPEGKLRWKFSTQGPITSSPAIGGDGVIYFTSNDGNLYAVNPDGTEKWRLPAGGASESSPVIGDGGDIYLVVYTNTGGHLDSISRAGKKEWEWSTADVWNDTTPVVLANGDVYFAGPWVTLQGFHPNGQRADTIYLPGNVTSSPVVAGSGTIYFTCGRDFVAAMPTNGAPLAKSSWPMFRANPRHTGRVAGP